MEVSHAYRLLPGVRNERGGWDDDRSVGSRTTALPPFFVRTLPDPHSPLHAPFADGVGLDRAEDDALDE